MKPKSKQTAAYLLFTIFFLIFFSYSVPDALSGIAVVKEGHGDMAVSNAIGSNVFDILVCLGNVCCFFTKKKLY